MPAHNKQKQQIREEIAALKATLPKETKAALSQKISERLIQSTYFQKAHCIALYYALTDEVQTAGLIESWYQKKKIVLPVVCGDELRFYTYTGSHHLKKGALGISEPDITNPAAEWVAKEEIDLFVVPGIAFDRNGNRMGRGKGYYDRYFAGIKADTHPIIGLCFDFQLLPEVPTEPHDRKMTYVITESLL